MKAIHLFWLVLLCFVELSAHAQKPELVVPIGHTDAVNSVAYSPKGQLLASGSSDQTIRFWSVKTGQLVRTLQDKHGPISSVCFSPDGELLASGTYQVDFGIKLWSVRTGKYLGWLPGHEDGVTSLCFSPDGQYLASGSHDKTVKLWAAKTGQLLTTLEGHSQGISSVCFSPDGQQVASGSYDGTIKLWSVRTGELLGTLHGHTDRIYSISFSRDGQLASGSKDNSIKLWSVQTWQCLGTLQSHSDGITSVCFSQDGQRLASSSFDNTIKLWSAKTGQLVNTLQGHSGSIHSICFSPNGQQLASGSIDNTIKLWSVQTGQIVRTLQSHSHVVNSVCFSPNGQQLAYESDNTIKLWSAKTGELIKTLRDSSGVRRPICFSPDGQQIAFGLPNKKGVKLWSVGAKQLVRTLQESSDPWSICFSPDGQQLATCSPYDHEGVKVWSVQTGELIRTLGGPTSRANVFTMCFSPDGQYLAAVFLGGTIGLWSAKTWQLVHTFQGHARGVTSLCFSPDGENLAFRCTDGTIALWSVKSRQLRSNFLKNSGEICFSPDGQQLASAYSDNTIKLWSAKTGAFIRTFEGYLSGVTSLTFSRDGQQLVSGSKDNTTKIWNTATGNEIATLIAVDSTDWVVTTPAGLFDASPGALELMHYVVNDSTDYDEPWKVIELNQLKQRYYEPGLLRILMGYSTQKLRNVEPFKDVPLPPAIQLEIRNDTLHLSLKNRRGDIGKVSVLFNRAEVVEDLRPNPAQNATQNALTLSLPLTRFANRFDTLNTIRVVALNRQGWISSRPEEIEYRPAALSRGVKIERTASATELDTLRLRAVVVGTSNIGLRFAHKDAEQIANGLRLAAIELLGKPNVDVELLTTQPDGAQQSTKADIVKMLEAAQSLRPRDTFVLYLAGHGINYSYGGQDDFYYLTAGARAADVAYLSDSTNRQTHTLSSAELTHYLNLIPANKKLLILDVCAAGKGAEKLLVAARDIPPSQIRALETLQGRSGFYVLAGTAADAVSYESNVYGQGLLTYALLEGMRGGKLRREGNDEYLNVEEWLRYAVEQVPLLAKEIRGIQQPFYRGLDTDKTDNHRSFDVGKVTPAIKAQIHLAAPKPVMLVRSFQQETKYDDVLHLTAQLEGVLIDLSARGADAPMLFMEAKDYPGAYALMGGYTVKGEAVQVTCIVKQGDAQIGDFVVTGQKSKLPELAQSVLTQAQGLVKPK